MTDKEIRERLQEVYTDSKEYLEEYINDTADDNNLTLQNSGIGGILPPAVPVSELSHYNSGSIRISPNFPTFRCRILTKDNLINLFLYPFVILFIIANLLIE